MGEDRQRLPREFDHTNLVRALDHQDMPRFIFEPVWGRGAPRIILTAVLEGHAHEIELWRRDFADMDAMTNAWDLLNDHYAAWHFWAALARRNGPSALSAALSVIGLPNEYATST